MKFWHQFLLAVLSLVLFMVFDGFIYMAIYDLGFSNILIEFGFNPPHISYISFILFAGAIHILGNSKSDESKQYAFNDPVGWGRVISIYVTKILMIFSLWLVNIILL